MQVSRRWAAVWACVAACVSLAVCATPAWADARLRALLVGVSNYPAAMVGDLQLKGPKNDVALMLETTARAGFADADMIVLADGLADTGSKRLADGAPTRAAIMAGLAKLAQDSAAGDFVLVYMTGHGSQQPDLNPGKRPVPKADGLDEVFLPIDLGRWDDAKAGVENAILDFELGVAVNAIRARGATVWVVIDACHSGTMTRGAGTEAGAARQVPAQTLGIPQALLDKAHAAGASRGAGAGAGAGAGVAPQRSWVFGQAGGGTVRGAGAADGGYVAFFAAYPDQVAREENLPKSIGAKAGKAPHGLLTFYLAQAMRSGRVSTFRDLAHLVLAGYGQFGTEAPTPMFEGDLGTRFPGGGDTAVRRFPIRRGGAVLTLDAGVVDGVTPGALIALADAADPARPRAYARVLDATVASASLVLTPHDGKEASLAGFSANALVVGSVAEAGVDLAFKVARPAQGDAAPAIVTAALEALAQAKQGITIVEPGNSADLYLRFASGRLWLVPETGRFEMQGRSPTPSLYVDGPDQAGKSDAGKSDAGKTQGLIEAQLRALAKAQMLIRVAGAMNAQVLAATLNIEAFVLNDAGTSQGSAALEEADQRNCGAWDAAKLPANAVPFADLANAGLTAAAFAQCDQLYFRLTNTGTKPVDITPLYINSVGGITYVGPRGTGLRLDPKDPPRLLSIRIRTRDKASNRPQVLGQERLLFIAVEVDGRQAFASNFDYLEQAVPDGGNANRGGGAAPLRALLEAAAFGATTRSASAPAGTGMAGIAEFRWNTILPDRVR